MKKFLLVFIFILLFCSNINAQTTGSTGPYLGPYSRPQWTAIVDSLNKLRNEMGDSAIAALADSIIKAWAADDSVLAEVKTGLDSVLLKVDSLRDQAARDSIRIDSTGLRIDRDSVRIDIITDTTDLLRQLVDRDSIRTDRDSIRIDSLSAASLGQDTTLNNLLYRVAGDSVSDSTGGILKRIKGTGVIRFLNPTDSTKIDSITISASGSGGGGYTDYWNLTYSDTMKVPSEGALFDFDLPSIAWPGKPDGATIFRAYIMLKPVYAYTYAQFLYGMSIYAKHESGTYGVDDVLAFDNESYGTFFRISYTVNGSVSGGVLYCPYDISSILADTAHAVNIKAFDVDGHTYPYQLDMQWQVGIRVEWGDKPNSMIVWGKKPQGTSFTTTDNVVIDSITIPTLPTGASIARANVVWNNWCYSRDASTDSILTVSSDIAVAQSGGAYTTGAVLDFASHPVVINQMSKVQYYPGYYSLGLVVGDTDVSSVVTGAGNYAINMDGTSTATVGYAMIQAGIQLIFSY